MIGRLYAALGLVALAACGSSLVAVPQGVTFRVEQTRTDLKGRNIAMQVVNGGSKPITVSRVEFTSGRLDKPGVYRGLTTIPDGVTTNLILAMPRARCAAARKGIEASIQVTYAVGDGKEVTSVVRPKDHYGSVVLLMKRDCAESATRGVADIAVDRKLAVRGEGLDSELELGVTFTPLPNGKPVLLEAVDSTVLLAFAPGANGMLDHQLEPGGAPYRAVLRIVPARCDVHVVAEDKAGTLLPIHVRSKQSGDAFFYLQLTEAHRSQIFDFVARHCRFGDAADPLLAP